MCWFLFVIHLKLELLTRSQCKIPCTNKQSQAVNNIIRVLSFILYYYFNETLFYLFFCRVTDSGGIVVVEINKKPDAKEVLDGRLESLAHTLTI